MHSRHLFFCYTLLCMMFMAFQSHAFSTASIEIHHPSYDLDLRYPQQFSSPLIDETIEKVIISQQEKALSHFKSEKVAEDAPGKNSLSIQYTIPYQEHLTLSVLLSVDMFQRGAAHPYHQLLPLNFVDGQPVKLGDLFVSDSDYLAVLAKFSQQKLLQNKKLDKKWLMDGSSPQAEHYQKWLFHSEGLIIIFDTYQVAPYVYGPQKVFVPLSAISDLLKKDVKKVVWGHG